MPGPFGDYWHGEIDASLRARWNGHSQDGRQAASGIYFYRLQIDKQVMTGRVQMLK